MRSSPVYARRGPDNVNAGANPFRAAALPAERTTEFARGASVERDAVQPDGERRRPGRIEREAEGVDLAQADRAALRSLPVRAARQRDFQPQPRPARLAVTAV